MGVEQANLEDVVGNLAYVLVEVVCCRHFFVGYGSLDGFGGS